MDTLNKYHEIICQLFEGYVEIESSNDDIRVESIIDPEKGHYQILLTGWMNGSRVHGTTIHIDVIGDKVWVQHDSTSLGVVDDLLEAGIPKDKIVLGFKPPHVRPLTGFAAA